MACRPAPSRRYRQSIDMRTGTARTSYDWTRDGRHTSVKVETFVSRASPGLAVTRLDITPRYSGPLRLRFAIAGWPEPKRLALATVSRAGPDWGPKDVWYPGHTIVQSRTRPRDRRRTPLDDVEARRTCDHARPGVIGALGTGPRRRRRWPRVASGDTARLEMAFDATADRTYSFSQITSLAMSANSARAGHARCAPCSTRPGPEDPTPSPSANDAAWARRWETDIVIDGDPALQRVVRSMLFYLLVQRRLGNRARHSAHGALERRLLRPHVLGFRHVDVSRRSLLTHPDVARSLVAISARARSALRRPTRAPTGTAARCIRGKPTSGATRRRPHFAVQNAQLRDPRQRRRGHRAVAVLPRHRATPPGWRAGLSRHPRDRRFLGEPSDATTRARPLPHRERGVGRRGARRSERRRLHQQPWRERNLEIATEASRRLGGPPTRAGPTVAAKLHMPFDSATQIFRTYEGAPDSTLGWITPLLSLPARRADERSSQAHAPRRRRVEASRRRSRER